MILNFWGGPLLSVCSGVILKAGAHRCMLGCLCGLCMGEGMDHSLAAVHRLKCFTLVIKLVSGNFDVFFPVIKHLLLCSGPRRLPLTPWEANVVNRLQQPTHSYLARSRSAMSLSGDHTGNVHMRGWGGLLNSLGC